MTQYVYDASGDAFTYFLFILSGFVLSSITIYSATARRQPKSTKVCPCSYCAEKSAALRLGPPIPFRNWKSISLTIGWIIFGLLAKRAWDSRFNFSTATYSPFHVLELSEDATDVEIRKQYKNLGLRYHPDRVPEDEKQQAEARFVEISKAYKILVDEDARRKFEETGNPDGINDFVLGIALPAWVMEAGNRYLVLGFYGLVFGMLLPYLVGKWWHLSNSYTKQKIHYSTMARYYKELKETSSIRQLVEIVAGSKEFELEIRWTPQDNSDIPSIWKAIRQAHEDMFPGEKYQETLKVSHPDRVKTMALLLAHLYRVNVPGRLARDQAFVVEKSFVFTVGLIQIATAREWIRLIDTIILFGQLVVQAAPDVYFSLLQLPGLNTGQIRSIRQVSKTTGKEIKSPQELLVMEPSKRNALLDQVSIPGDKFQMFAGQFQRLSCVRQVFRVIGQETITPDSIISCSFYFLLTGLDNASFAKLKNLEFPSNDGVFSIGTSESRQKEGSAANEHLVHCPYFPTAKPHQWWAVVVLGRSTLLYPQKITIPSLESLENNQLFPSLTFQFKGPSIPGALEISVSVECDSVMGGDFSQNYKITIVPDDQ